MYFSVAAGLKCLVRLQTRDDWELIIALSWFFHAWIEFNDENLR